ncbi:MAG: hypothetical protein AAFO03_28665 [Bacteroidota bacterium]
MDGMYAQYMPEETMMSPIYSTLGYIMIDSRKVECRFYSDHGEYLGGSAYELKSDNVLLCEAARIKLTEQEDEVLVFTHLDNTTGRDIFYKKLRTTLIPSSGIPESLAGKLKRIEGYYFFKYEYTTPIKVEMLCPVVEITATQITFSRSGKLETLEHSDLD